MFEPTRILVIDDDPLHQQSAQEAFGGDYSYYDLTVVGTYDEAHALLQPAWMRAEGHVSQGRFSFVLCGPLVSADSVTIRHEYGKEHVGKEVPASAYLALRALAHGAFVAIVGDTDHDLDLASTALRDINPTRSGCAVLAPCYQARHLDSGGKDWRNAFQRLGDQTF